MKSEPNIFRHATSELSQDAFLAWLCEWADEAHTYHPSGMHAVGRAFIAWLYAKKGWSLPNYNKAEVRLQYLHIDVLVKLTTPDGEVHHLLIEDKTYTSDHSEQINGYLRSLKEKEYIEDPSRVLPVYFKSSLEPRKSDGHLRLYLTDIVDFISSLDKSGVQSEVFHSWCEMRTEAHLAHERFRSLPVREWKDDQWYGCFDHMARQPVLATLSAGYGYVHLGNFIGFWIGWVGEPEDWCTYLQVDAYRSRPPALTFRIAAPKNDFVGPAFMKGTFNSLQAAASSMGKRILYPKWARIGGKSSRYAVLDEPFMAQGEDGTFDESFMTSQLLACHELLVRAPIAHML
ncbi:MAG: PD-(D/E)XK nuclease family protein [Flavobacteriales bacterium]|nr:PD-(D/E)XK nuclease family protein [Flavobacteriales bacterium]